MWPADINVTWFCETLTQIDAGALIFGCPPVASRTPAEKRSGDIALRSARKRCDLSRRLGNMWGTFAQARNSRARDPAYRPTYPRSCRYGSCSSGASAGAARDARLPRRSSSSCDRPAPSAARRPSGRRTAGSPAGKAPGHPPQKVRQQRGPGIIRYRGSSDCRILIVSHKPIGSRTSTRSPI